MGHRIFGEPVWSPELWSLAICTNRRETDEKCQVPFKVVLRRIEKQDLGNSGSFLPCCKLALRWLSLHSICRSSGLGESSCLWPHFDSETGSGGWRGHSGLLVLKFNFVGFVAVHPHGSSACWRQPHLQSPLWPQLSQPPLLPHPLHHSGQLWFCLAFSLFFCWLGVFVCLGTRFHSMSLPSLCKQWDFKRTPAPSYLPLRNLD